MTDFLDKLAKTALDTIESGYYQSPPAHPVSGRGSFVKALQASSVLGLITEVKPASPSGGQLLGDRSPCEVVDLYVSRAITGLSILTEPVYFEGALDTLNYAASKGFPILFKDFVLGPEQLEAAQVHGAAAVLLILALFERGYAALPLDQMIQAAHERGLEVLLEVYDAGEYERALGTEADMIGINNRDLKTLQVDLDLTQMILANRSKDRLVWSLSGVLTPGDLAFLKNCGADACLIGTALMQAGDPKGLLGRLIAAS